jgi:hypothetical protein
VILHLTWSLTRSGFLTQGELEFLPVKVLRSLFFGPEDHSRGSTTNRVRRSPDTPKLKPMPDLETFSLTSHKLLLCGRTSHIVTSQRLRRNSLRLSVEFSFDPLKFACHQ